jgi:hypothetical protein
LIGNALFERDPHNLPGLKGPPEDLKLFERALIDPQTGIHDKANVRTLLDGTNSEVREAIDDFFNSAGPGDQLLFYYSGHGRQDANNSLYLCTRDTRTDRLASTAVGDVLINQMIATSHAARTLIILDCCHSGSFKGGGMPEALAQASGRFLLTSCRDQQLATDAEETGGASAFTRHLVQALTDGDIDVNHDGFVTLSEIYHSILPKLKLATQQIPQLHLDKTVGDPPLARVKAKRSQGDDRPDYGRSNPSARPILGVSDTRIDFQDVRLGEQLPPVTIDVFNEGDGELNWSATTDDAWIEIEPGKNAFKLRLKPVNAGPHRGSVYVRDAGRGGSKRISVFAEVIETTVPPQLSVAQHTLEFGQLKVGEKAAPHVIRLTNRGGGELRATARCDNPAVRVSVQDDVVSVDPDVARAGSLAGEIWIESAGGRAMVRVTGEVARGPVLVVKPTKKVDFGSVAQSRLSQGGVSPVRLDLENSGSGELVFTCELTDRFFSLRTAATHVDVALNPALGPGDYLGAFLIRSNGGDATVNVRVHVEMAVPPPLPPQPPTFVDISGWWQNPNGRIFVSGPGPVFQYIDYNAFGAQIGSGTLTVNGNQVLIQGMSLFVPYTGQLAVNGPVLSGTLICFGSPTPVFYSRC